MVVEDEKNLASLLRKYLEREGFEVHEAPDGNAAIEVAGRVEPDVVVLDWMLPGLDGMEVLRELRRFSGAYVVMLTARTEEVDRIVGPLHWRRRLPHQALLSGRAHRPHPGDAPQTPRRCQRGG